MKAIVGSYKSREDAEKSHATLLDHGFIPMEVTLINKDELLHNHISVRPHNTMGRVEIVIGFVGGMCLGVLIGLGVFDFAPLHLLYGKGLLPGAIAGSIVGLWIGGVVGFISSVVGNKMLSSKYEKDLNEGKFLVLVAGTRGKIQKAHEIIQTPDIELELD
ncbi:MAG: hypothetical protein IPP77_15745 [Bacteroidetes bacterium]|nr:hypothetical protein [Bacteroidota bacterium]